MMKTRTPHIPFSKLTLALLISLTLEACQVPDKTQVPMPEKPYILKHDTQKLVLHFHGQSSKLPEEEEMLLLSSLKPSGPGKVSVHITLPAIGSPLGKKRLKSIIQTALEAGVKAKQIHKGKKLPAVKGQSVEMILDTYRAIPPLCPNWSMAYGPGYDRGPTSNFGCATAVNFLLMIDDPIVLFKGEAASSRDSARDALSIADHRAGKDKGKWLKVEKADGGSSGGSGGGGNSGSGNTPS